MVSLDEMMVPSVQQQIPHTAVKPSSSTTLHVTLLQLLLNLWQVIFLPVLPVVPRLANLHVDKFLSDPTIERLKSMSGLVVTEVKSSSSL
jgi:hypothetical protein